MKIGKNAGGGAKVSKVNVGKPAANSGGRGIIIGILVIATVALIVFIMSIGNKATRTVPVVMFAQTVHKNQLITEDMLVKYDMIQAEFEKFKDNEDGTLYDRIVLWDDRDILFDTYAAYPLLENTLAYYDQFITDAVNNQDTALYNFPGKQLVILDVGTDNLSEYSTYLEPGDRINLIATYMETITRREQNQWGEWEEVELGTSFKTETVFNGIMMADMLNSNGNSILDLMYDYRTSSAWEQQEMIQSEEWNDLTHPETLVLALTPEEVERYYYYENKDEAEFHITLPQRID